MKQDINKLHSDFISFFNDNNIVCIHLNSSEEKTIRGISCETEKTTQDSIKKIILDLKPKYIYLDTIHFQPVDNLKISKHSEPDDLERFKELHNSLTEFTNSITEFTIYIPLDNSTPKFTYYHPEIENFEEYETLEKAIEEIDDENYEGSDEDDFNFETKKLKKLSKDEITSLIERLLKEDDYIKSYNTMLRRDFIYDFFEAELVDCDIDDLIAKSELALDKFLSNKIKEMRKSGKRKVDIISELGISKHRVDKYY